MICNTCAKEVMDYSAFCYHCGAKIIVVTPKAVVPNSQTHQPTVGKSATAQYIAVQNVCPVCRKNDQIQRVKSIVDAGTHHTYGSSTATYTTDLSGRLDHYSSNILPDHLGSSDLSGIAHSSRTTYSHATEKTALAEKLRSPWMPQEPILPKKRELGCLTWILILFAFFPFVGLLVLTYFYFFNPQELAKQQIDTVIIQQCVVWPFVAVLVTLIQVISNKSKTKEDKLAYDQKMVQYKNDMLYWEQAYRRWETMYYCYRDHVIFILGEPQFANPDQIIAFCYQHTE